MHMAVDDNPFRTFGCVVSHVRRLSDRSACAAGVRQGAPLLAFPLDVCWTAHALAQEHPNVAQVLAAAQSRNPAGSLLRHEATWIAVHLVYEKQLAEKARPDRRAYLETVPQEPDTLLAWSDRDLELLAGSRWRQVTRHCRAQLAEDFKALSAELGPKAKELGLSEPRYVWAHQVIQKYGMQFMASSGSALLVVAPGLNFLEPDSTKACDAESAQLELTALSDRPTLVLYADRDYSAGEEVKLRHGCLATSNGGRLMSCGVPLRHNPLASVELKFQLPVDLINRDRAVLQETMAGLEELFTECPPPRPKLGGCIPVDILNGSLPVELVSLEGGLMMKLTVSLRKDKLVPSQRGLICLGGLLVTDQERQQQAIDMEQDAKYVLGDSACRRRGLMFLCDRIKDALQEYRSETKTAGAAEGGSSRTASAGILVAEEMQILSESLLALQEELAQPDDDGDASPPPRVARSTEGAVAAALLEFDGDVVASSALGKTLALIQGRSHVCQQLAEQFARWRSDRTFSTDQGLSLRWELHIVRSSLGRCHLGDPISVKPAVFASSDAVAKVFNDAAAALQRALLESALWEQGRLQEALRVRPADEAVRDQLATTTMEVALLQMRMLEFDKALETLRGLLRGQPSSDAATLVGECAMSMAARSEEVLGSSWEGHEQTLQSLHKKLRDMGFMRVARRWTYPPRLPFVSNLASDPSSWEGGISGEAVLEEALLPSTQGGGDQDVERAEKLGDAVRLFMLRSMLPLGRVCSILGREACCLLLKSRMLSCYDALDVRLLDPVEALARVPPRVTARPKLHETGTLVFANAMLWPLQDDLLVAFDFEQLAHSLPETLPPVPYLAEDVRALMAAAVHVPAASQVLVAACGCGAAGLVALSKGAGRATFMDSSVRALNFARFGACLNGVGGRADFAHGSMTAALPATVERTSYDLILAGATAMVTPGSVTASTGVLQGGPDGLAFIQALLSRSSAGLLAPGGMVLATLLLPNQSAGMVEHLEKWVDGAGGSRRAFRATLLRGEAVPSEAFAELASGACADTTLFALRRGLQREGISSMSQALVLFRLLQPGVDVPKSRVEVRPICSGLWSDVTYCQRALQDFTGDLKLPSQETTLYAMDWCEGREVEGVRAGVASGNEGPERGATRPSTGREVGDRLASLILPPFPPRAMKWALADGASWSDIMYLRVVGFAPPVLCECLWRQTAVPLGRDFPPRANAPPGAMRIPPTQFQMAVVEFPGCAALEPVKVAMRMMDCYDTLTFDPEKQELVKNYFGGWRKPQKEGEAPPPTLNKYDTLVLAFPKKFEGVSMAKMAERLSIFLRYCGDHVATKRVALRIVVLTCGANGPTFPDGPGEEMHDAACLRGLLRCLRQELSDMPILTIDTDELGEKGDPSELAAQVIRELEAHTPPAGMENCTAEEFNEAIYKTHGELAYRHGDRFLPGLELSQRNPVHADAKLSHLRARSDDDDVAVITGGTGGLGVVSAQALVEGGVRCVVLTSRSGKIYSGQGLEERIEAMRAIGARIELETCDTSSPQSVADMLQRVRSGLGPIRYVLHAAGVFSLEYEPCFAPKVPGAWALHQHTLQDPVETFLTYGSMTECLGTAGMEAYGCANTYMDELCRYRHALGLPGTAVLFPEVQGVGMAGSNRKDAASLDNEVVLQVIKQVAFGTEPAGPVLAIMTKGFLLPRPPISHVFHEPLRNRIDWGLYERLRSVESEAGRKQFKELRRVVEGR